MPTLFGDSRAIGLAFEEFTCLKRIRKTDFDDADVLAHPGAGRAAGRADHVGIARHDLPTCVSFAEAGLDIAEAHIALRYDFSAREAVTLAEGDVHDHVGGPLLLGQRDRVHVAGSIAADRLPSSMVLAGYSPAGIAIASATLCNVADRWTARTTALHVCTAS